MSKSFSKYFKKWGKEVCKIGGNLYYKQIKYYRKIHSLFKKYVRCEWGRGEVSLKSKLRWTGRGGTCKTNRNEQGGRGFKNWKFRANILFDWPYTPHKWVISKFHFSNIWWKAIKVGENLPVTNNLILVSSLVLVKKCVNLQRFFQ